MRALSLLGVAYRLGGESAETGMDCSGLVRWVYRQSAGIDLPRRSEDMAAATVEIPISSLVPGDLVFFNTLKRRFSHVGVYIGEGRFVHAPTTNGVVRIERFEQRYWQQRFDGARRVTMIPGRLPGQMEPG